MKPIGRDDDHGRVAIITRGAGTGRAFVVTSDAKVHELTRIADIRVTSILQAVEWLGGA